MADNLFADLIPSGTPGVIMGPPKLPDKPNLPAGWEIGPDGKARIIPGYVPKGEEGDDPDKAALSETIRGLGVDELLTGVKRAREKVKTGWATGLWGAAGGMVPGSTRNDFLGTLDQIQGGIIMEKLQALKDLSKTGASGMGALSEREGARLAASVAAITPDMSADEIERSLREIERHALTLKAVADGADPTDPAVAKKYGIPPADMGLEIDETGKPRNLRDDRNFAAAEAADGPPPLEVEVVGGRDPTAEEARAEADRITKREGAPGVKDILTHGITLGLTDEAAGVGRGLSFALAGKNPIAGYRLGRDAERLRIEDVRHQLGFGATALEVAGGFLSANPQSALAPLAARGALIRQGAKSGAAGGALAGFGYGEGTEGSVGGAALGYGVGGALGAGISGLSALAAPSARAAQTTTANVATNARIAQAAEAEGVKLSTPMMAGNRRAVNKAGMLEADPITAPIIQQGFADTADDIAAGVERLKGSGQAGDRQAQGEVFRKVGKDLMQADREGAKVAYDAAAQVQPDAMVDAVAMRSKITREIERLQQLPGQNAGKIRDLKVYLKDLSNPKPLQAIRDMRTALRDDIAPANLGLSSDKKAIRRTLLGIIDGSKTDIERSLTPEALSAWKAADAEFAQNQVFYKQALKPFLGEDFDKLPAEAIFDRVKSAANSNGRALAALHRRLDPDQSRNFAATIADGLGKRSPDEEFSPALFMSQARRYSKSARETIFGPSGAASFDNLLVLSRRLQAAQKEVNQSKTARPMMNAIRQKTGIILMGLLGAGGAGLGGPVGGGVGVAAAGTAMVISAARKAMTAKALMNPRFTRWMAQASRIGTQPQLDAHIQKLSGIAAREPGIAGEISQLQQSLSPAVAESADDQEAE